MKIGYFKAESFSLVTREGKQLIKILTEADMPGHIIINVLNMKFELAITSGEYRTEIFLPAVKSDTNAKWEIFSLKGEHLYSCESIIKKPREWKINIMLSSHTDIGLHNPNYFQRYNTESLLDKAAALCDIEPSYGYTLEGTWCFDNYNMDRGAEEAENILENYIKKDKIGICAGIAGNHTHAYGFEELARSIAGKEKLLRKYNIKTETLAMIDNNGLSWGIVAPYAEAGIKNILFAPNQWNPLSSTIWKSKNKNPGNNPENGGGGSRIELTFDSALPRVFWWQSKDKSKKILVFGGGKYSEGAELFGFSPYDSELDILKMEKATASALEKMEKRTPYDMWLLPCYYDDQEPSLHIVEGLKKWNEKWAWPSFEIIGNINNFFTEFKNRFDSVIPTLSGEITGGWYQHPLSAPQLLADKLEADRRLANAESFGVLASIYTKYEYPLLDFSRAWEYLLLNDEHSYGTSGYQGRRVYETWMQHRDWIEKAAETAKKEGALALDALTESISAEKNSIIVFNPTARNRNERIDIDGKTAIAYDIPPLGYRVISNTENIEEKVSYPENPPVIENEHYRIIFSESGSMTSIFDKHLGREIISKDKYGANCFVYTDDNHKTYATPKNAKFEVIERQGVIKVMARMNEPRSGAEIIQTVTLDSLHHRIDIQNDLLHISSMINNDRYYRYIYYAFPFDVPGAKKICQLNGCEAEYAKDLTGHTTDTYMNAHEWALSENDKFGAVLIQRDSLLVEFDHIHPDKTDFGAAGDGSEIYSYVSNDWLQMHEVGGRHVELHLRYSITSWQGSYLTAGVREMAECFVNPQIIKKKENEGGNLPGDSYSFIEIPDEQRFICLKGAENGEGAILRLYGEKMAVTAKIGSSYSAEQCDINENPINETAGGMGLTSIRFREHNIKRREDTKDIICEEKPAPIGSVYTGLITKPRAACGENDGHLYLLWGQNMEKNLSHYELYRSKEQGFIPDDGNFVAIVLPEEYRVARYVDEGLETHTEYFYRVRAVNTNGVCGDFSEEFSAYTKEPIK